MTTTGRPLPTQIRSGGDANKRRDVDAVTAAPPVARMRMLLEPFAYRRRRHHRVLVARAVSDRLARASAGLGWN